MMDDAYGERQIEGTIRVWKRGSIVDLIIDVSIALTRGAYAGAGYVHAGKRAKFQLKQRMIVAHATAYVESRKFSLRSEVPPNNVFDVIGLHSRKKIRRQPRKRDR